MRTTSILHRHASFLPSLFLASLLTASHGGPVNDNKASSDESGDPWSVTLMGGGVKTNDAYTDGNLFLTVPLWSTIGRDRRLGGDYLFIEPYSSVGSGGEVAASLGLSWRHLFSDQSASVLAQSGRARILEEGWFLGGSLFMDMLDTAHRNTFWQLGIGAEIGTRYFEIRGNYYVPLTGQKLAERDVSTRSFSSTSYDTQSSYGDPFATGNSIQQFVASRTFATTTTTTVRTVTELFEKGMQGWDAEASVLVPGLDQWIDLRLIGGYFSFDNQPFGPQRFGTGHVHGWKAGVELRPVPAIVLSGMWYQDKRLTGGNWTVGAQLQVPLDRTWKDAFTMRRRHLVEHLAEPVHRQNDAIKIGNREEQHSSTSVQRVTRVVKQTNQQVVLADDIVFVNNGDAVGNGIQAGSAAGNGTAEKPKNTISDGATIAQANSNSTGRVWNVYTQGTAAGYKESVDVTTGSVNFIGSGKPVNGLGGRTFGTGVMPYLDGGLSAHGVPRFGVTGYSIANGFLGTYGLFAFNVGSVEWRDNVVADAAANIASGALGIVTSGATTSTAIVRGNTITNSGASGIVMSAGDTSNVEFVAAGNTVSNAKGYGIEIATWQSAGVHAAVSVNYLSSGAEGLYLYSNNNSDLVTTADRNHIVGGPSAIKAIAFDSSKHTLLAADNILDSKAETFSVNSAGSTQVNITMTGNEIHAPSNGLDVIVWGHQTSSISLSSAFNIVTGGNLGIHLQPDDTSSISALLNGNSVTGIGLNGIQGAGLNGGSLSINGTISNDVNNVVGKRYIQSGTPSGTFIINGTTVNASADFP